MIEFLVAMMLMALTIGGIAAATFTAGTTGELGNEEARMNVLMTAFGEAVKALPYEKCAPASQYQTLFETSEEALPNDAADLRTASGATLTIVSTSPGLECPGIDSGVQTITLEVKIRDGKLTREIVKRTPDPGAVPLDFDIKDPTDPVNVHLQRSGPNDPLVVWGVEASGSSQIFQYEWWCDGDWAIQDPQPVPPAPDFTTNGPADAEPECRYPAPAEGVVQTERIALRVTEEGTNRVGVTSRAFQLPTTLAPHNPPLAQITVTSAPNCLGASPCAYNTPITFASTGPPPVDASILQWEWNFGDGTPSILCSPSSADPVGAACVNQVHTYQGGGEYPVKLTLVDSFGTKSATATYNVTITGPIKVKPVILGPDGALKATPLTGVSPQQVSFDASGSHADGVAAGAGSPAGGIANYYWEFGPSGAIQSGANLSKPTFTYPSSTVRETHVAKVTVTDVNGLTNFATVTIVLDPLGPPIGLANSGARKGDLPFIRNAYFDFQWTNVPRSPGDTVQTVIKIASAGGFCGFLGVGVNFREFTVASGAAGTTQLYRAQFSSSPRGFNGVCATDSFTYSAKTIRTTSGGVVTESGWSNPQPLNPEFL